MIFNFVEKQEQKQKQETESPATNRQEKEDELKLMNFTKPSWRSMEASMST